MTLPADDKTTLASLRAEAARFVEERDWDQFHAPIQLAMGLGIEAAELQEIFLWKSPEQSDQLSPEDLERVRQESADVLMFLLHLSNRLDFDLSRAFADKLRETVKRYPADRVRGRADKYTAYE